MSAVPIAILWLAFVLPLTVAAVGRHSMGTKVGALLGLAVVLAASWLLLVMMLSMLAAHQDASDWPFPFLIAAAVFSGYAIITIAALKRKPL